MRISAQEKLYKVEKYNFKLSSGGHWRTSLPFAAKFYKYYLSLVSLLLLKNTLIRLVPLSFSWNFSDQDLP